MGGHGMSRSSQIYRNVATLGYTLAQEGFLVVTGIQSFQNAWTGEATWPKKHRSKKELLIYFSLKGGGPGAMEAGNLGAYMKNRSREELDEALAIISSGRQDPAVTEHEYTNIQPAQNVIQRFGKTAYSPRYLHLEKEKTKLIVVCINALMVFLSLSPSLPPFSIFKSGHTHMEIWPRAF